MQCKYSLRREEVGKVTGPSPEHPGTTPSYLLHNTSRSSAESRAYRLENSEQRGCVLLCSCRKAAIHTG